MTCQNCEVLVEKANLYDRLKELCIQLLDANYSMNILEQYATRDEIRKLLSYTPPDGTSDDRD